MREVYDMVTKQTPPHVDALERQHRRQDRNRRNRKVGAIAVVAAIGLVATISILATRPGGGTTTPATQPPANPNTVHPEAEQVARDFLQAFGDFDAERAMSYVAGGTDLHGLVNLNALVDPPLPQTSVPWSNLPQELPLLEAQGYQQTITYCEASNLPHETTVVCMFDFQALRSDEIGRGPFSGSNFTFTIRNGEIVGASMFWEIDRFLPMMWEPFVEWVSASDPQAFRAMYTDDGGFRLTEESIQLWEQTTKRYVQEVLRGNAQ